MTIFFEPFRIIKYVRQVYHDVPNTILTHYSPWTIANRETKKAQEGTAAPVKSSREIDLAQFLYSNQRTSWLPGLASLFRRNMHVVNDYELIQDALNKGRNNHQWEDYPIGLNTIIKGDRNMLLCQQNDHLRLRAPFERAFSLRNIKNETESIAIDLLMATTFDTSMTTHVEKLIDSSTAATQLLEEEKLSSTSLLQAAAQHTTQVTEIYICNLLNRHPDIATKILEAWECIFGEINESYVTQEQAGSRAPLRFCAFINGGDYLDQRIDPPALVHAVVLEALRLYPTVPQIVRVAKQNFEIGNALIQAGDVVILNIMGYQRDSRVWTDPESFNPDRWTTSENKIDTDLSKRLLTFSHGPYACIGKNLAVQYLLLYTTLTALRIGHREKGKSSIHFDHCVSGGLREKYYSDFIPKKEPEESLGMTPDYHISPPFLDETSFTRV